MAARKRAALERKRREQALRAKRREAARKKALALRKKQAALKARKVAAQRAKQAAALRKRAALERARKAARARLEKARVAARRKAELGRKAARAAASKAKAERAKAKREAERARQAARREREQAAAKQRREREAAAALRARALQAKLRAKTQAAARAEREVARKAARAAKEAARQAAREARETEKARLKAEREAERERVRLQREAEREETRKAREKERLEREAEREAYRKAREAERERLRAEREAARRALEGKVARASRIAARAAQSGRSSGRVYRPSMIPNQAGTTRRVDAAASQPTASQPFASSGPLEPPPELASSPTAAVPEPPAPARPAPPQPPPAPTRDASPEAIEERYARIQQRLDDAGPDFRRQYGESFDMSWIHHDSALEGVVFTFPELKMALDPSVTVVPDSSLQPVCEEIRRHKAAVDLVRDLGEKRRASLTVDVIKKIFLTLHPEEGDLKSVRYRRDIPQHRLYFHEYSAPDKIAYKVRQVVDWLSGPEPKKLRSPVRIAARVHFDLVRVFPFQTDSGKVARLVMNLVLLRSGYPPAIIHAAERQRYYEALKGALPVLVSMVGESITNALASIEKLLDEHEHRQRLFGPPPA
ncbi:MAG: Fic family protein [Polyangiaceae bacterium]|nr:Fic family protein [Polyangiaceae bacterium]